MRMHKRVGVVFLLLVASAAAIAVLSPGGSMQMAATPVDNDAAAAGTAGLRVFLDPETGETLSDPDPNAVIELDSELENALRHDTEGLASVYHANGAVSIDLDGRYQEASVVRIDENGKRIICTDNIANIEKALDETTPTAPEVK